jgi:hypothetical protein
MLMLIKQIRDWLLLVLLAISHGDADLMCPPSTARRSG